MEELCRICISEKTHKDVFSLPNELQVEKTAKEVMMFCLSIELCEDSKFGTLLCESCYSSIISFYKFKVLALQSDEHLKSKRLHTTEDQKVEKLSIESGLDEIEIKQEFDHSFVKFEKLNEYSDDNFFDSYSFEIGDIEVNESLTESLEKKRHCQRKLPKVEEKTECPACGKKVKCLRQHMIYMHHMPKDEKPAACAECGRKFLSLHKLASHIDKFHNNSERISKQEKCELCNKNVRDLVKHTRKHHNSTKPLPCEFCFKTFNNTIGLEQHLNMHLKEKRFYCNDCDSKYFAKLALEMHIRKNHLNLRLYKCQRCKKGFSRKSHLERHRLTHKDPTTTKKPNDVCPICGNTYQQLKHHMRTHQPKHARQCYQCKLCQKNLLTAPGLKRHYKFVHNRKRVKCNICNKEVSHLKQHNLRLHSSRPFACNCCPLQFATENLLRLHANTHTDERPFECTQCGNRYKLKTTMELHVRAIHKGEKRFLCQVCSKAFFSKTHLERHLICHSDERKYKCELCQKAMKTSEALHIHMDRHRGVKKHLCSICGMAFVTSSACIIHKLTHSKEKRHPCRFCDVRFGRTDHRNRHERTAHGKQLESFKKGETADQS